MKIAVVILNWNGMLLLEKFLPSIAKYSPEASIYIADNASTDDSISYLKTFFPAVKVIINESNLGFAGGYNEALKSVNADLYALVNSDIEVTENWLQPIIKTFENQPETAIIQPKILDYNRKDYFEYAGAAGGFIDAFGYPFCRGRIFDSLEKDQGQYNDESTIFWASGACFFIRSEVYKKLNGFDGEFFAHQEEIDLCWRAINQGYRIKYNSNSVVYHVGGATLQQGNPTKTFLNFRNSLLMLTKNLPDRQLFKILFIRMILDGVAALQFLVQGKPKHFLAILKAHWSFYGFFRIYYKKRDKAQKLNYYHVKSIVYAYYVNKIRVFNDLFRN
ncbi:GT2 family glycosyltransferase [Flavobacterium sp. PL11]|uniref:glycosyltransferase family 2 protein n=1 Tax=Flavobacterium sp. PL11 TaxID=3071717 RepID=UPI002E012812|nr:GT2 family glycosyltransferase [Flavobacterium sp. PL11]